MFVSILAIILIGLFLYLRKSQIPLELYKSVLDSKNKEIEILSQKLAAVEGSLSDFKSQQQSKSVRLGLISEVVLPFHPDFPYNPKDLRPLFQPIDYMAFLEDEIVFIEMKVGTSNLSEKQKLIRRLVKEKKVRWEEHRVDEKGCKIK